MNFKELQKREINEGGIQYIVKFENNYGASIVQHHFSYGNEQGLWELAVIKYEPNETDIYNFDLCYSTHITNDVLGYLSENDVNETLVKIKDLKND